MARIYKKGFSALLVCVMLLLALGTVIATAQDFDTPEQDLDTPVFSDESVEMVMMSASERGLQGSAPFEGTGDLTEEVGWLWDQGSRTPLSELVSPESILADGSCTAEGVNDSGVIVGSQQLAFPFSAFIALPVAGQ